jgi:hypothetical protein|nr:MAG TPA: hypothetical protein [Caudoviricetes sp.]
MRTVQNFWPELTEANETISLIRKGAPKDINEQIDLLNSDQEGVNNVISLLREISRKGANALHIASFIFSNLESMRHGNRELDLMLAEINCDKPLPAYMAEIGMMISLLDIYKIERIEKAIICNHELFNKYTMDAPLEEYMSEYK